MAIQMTFDQYTLVIPQQQDPCPLWQQYFRQLQAMVGKQRAKVLWLVTWQANGRAICTTEASFNQWLTQQQIDVSTTVSRNIAQLGTVGENLLGLSVGVSNVLRLAIPTVLVFVLLLLGYWVWNVSRTTSPLELASLATPMGRVLNALPRR